MDITERKNMAKAKVAEVIAQAEKIYGVDLSNFTLRFDIRGRALGQAQRRGNCFTIRLNPAYMVDDAGWDYIFTNTIPHEVAHLVCFANPDFGRNHDNGWKRVCLNLGGNSQRLAQVQCEVKTGRSTKRYEYTATCGTVVTLTTTRHNKIQRGASYILRKTGGNINRNCSYTLVA